MFKIVSIDEYKREILNTKNCLIYCFEKYVIVGAFSFLSWLIENH